MASFPQAPYHFATRGIQHQPKALHLGSFSVCLRSSVDNAAAAADNPATDAILGFSGDVTDISKAADLPGAQLGTHTTNTQHVVAVSTFTLKWALRQVSANTLRRWL